jgi:predicted Zn-dependent protease
MNIRFLAVIVLALTIVVAKPARAQEGPGLIRDAEIESDIRDWITPVFTAAGLDASFVKIYLVGDGEINSFVAGGQRIFINTGLIMRTQSPNQLIGVLAHETGHIAGGHLLRMQEALTGATVESIAGFLLGAAASVFSRDGSPLAAGAIAGSSMAQRSLFAYSINQEARADQAALTFLDAAHLSSRGLLQFFQILGKEEVLMPENQDPYLRTHPLTSQRIDYVRHHVETSPYSDNPDPPAQVEQHARILAKLRGFLSPPASVLAAYPPSDQSIAARYARAAAYHRLPDDAKALAEMDSLLKERPNDPYFWELRGQILFEGGHIAESVSPYRRAVGLAPDAALLHTELALAIVETGGNNAAMQEAVAEAKRSVELDDSDADSWHALGIAEGRLGDTGNAAVALAQEAMIEGDRHTAAQEAAMAAKLLPRGSPGWLRADDIRNTLKIDKR